MNDLNILYQKLKSLSEIYDTRFLDTMTFDQYPSQDKVYNEVIDRMKTKKGSNIFVVFGGNRSGKSEIGGAIVATLFRDFPSSRIWCATEPDLSVKVQQRKLAKLIRKKDIKYGTYTNQRGWINRTIVGRNDTVCSIKTYDQGRESFQGDDLDLIWFDEECPYDIYKESLIRLTDRIGIILLTFTSLNGFTKLVNKLWNSDDKNVSCHVLIAKENPFLSEEAKKQLLSSIDSDEMVSRWEGKPSIKQGLIYKEFSSIHKISRFDYIDELKKNPSRWELHEGIDPHERTPHHWLRFLFDRVNEILYVVDSLKATSESMIVQDFARLIKMKRNKIAPKYCQIDTSSMKPDIITKHSEEDQEDVNTVRLEFFKHGIETILVTKDNAVGISAVKERLKTVKTISGEIKRNPMLYVFDDLKDVIWEFERYSWGSYLSSKTEERKESVNQPLKKDDHYMDLVKYECLKLKTDIAVQIKNIDDDSYDIG